MDYKDITVDLWILEVQRYFVETQDCEMAARASFYTAAYWEEKKTECWSIPTKMKTIAFALIPLLSKKGGTRAKLTIRI